MLSEKHTNNMGRSYHRRKRRRSYRSAAIVFIIVALIMCVGIWKIGHVSLKNPYHIDDSLQEMLIGSITSDTAEAFASDLCVVDDTVDTTADGFSAESGILCSCDGGTSIYARRAFDKMYPASTTKIMTALLAIKYGNLDDMVTVPDDAVITEPGASLAHVNPGDKLTLQQLLYGLMLPSGNDAANAIAVHIGGSISGFTDMMNTEAQAIGATSTHFVNANGLSDDDHYTTAYDLYLIMHKALEYDTFRTIASTSAYVADYEQADGTMVSKTWSNGNKYLTGERQEPEGMHVVAGKTGTTQAAGSCLVLASGDDNEHEYISIVLKAENRESLYDNMSTLLAKITQFD